MAYRPWTVAYSQRPVEGQNTGSLGIKGRRAKTSTGKVKVLFKDSDDKVNNSSTM